MKIGDTAKDLVLHGLMEAKKEGQIETTIRIATNMYLWDIDKNLIITLTGLNEQESEVAFTYAEVIKSQVPVYLNIGHDPKTTAMALNIPLEYVNKVIKEINFKDQSKV